jgi:hypothetical protein
MDRTDLVAIGKLVLERLEETQAPKAKPTRRHG